MTHPRGIHLTKILLLTAALAAGALAADQVKIDSGMLEGTVNSDSSIRIFRGVPFAAPPVGLPVFVVRQHAAVAHDQGGAAHDAVARGECVEGGSEVAPPRSGGGRLPLLASRRYPRGDSEDESQARRTQRHRTVSTE